MKLFALNQYYFAFLGIDSYHANQKSLLNERSVTVLSSLCFSLILRTMYLIYEAQSPLEYTESLYVVSTLIAIISAFSIVLWEMPKLFEFINDFESSINQSEWKPTNETKSMCLRGTLFKSLWHGYVCCRTGL